MLQTSCLAWEKLTHLALDAHPGSSRWVLSPGLGGEGWALPQRGGSMRHWSVGRVRKGARQGLLEPSRVKGAPMQRESPVVSESRGLRGVYRQVQHRATFSC